MKYITFILLAGSFACTSAVADRPAGHIEGVAAFVGTPPTRALLVRNVDPVCATNKEQRSERIVVTGGKLKDVHIRIDGNPFGKHTVPATSVRINQTECMYRPRVLGIIRGQTLAIHNGDPTYHNVHGRYDTLSKFNFGHPAAAPPIEHVVLRKAGEVVRLGCDVHPWMQAYAVVSDHPFYDVTTANGKFRIPQVAPGTYTLVAWHPELGKRTANVVVRPGKTAQVMFQFKR